MNLFKNKVGLIVPVVALLVIFVFSLTLFPSAKVQPVQLPVALVNEDEGFQLPNQPEMNMGSTMVEMIEQMTSANPAQAEAFRWIEVGSEEEVKEGLDDQEYYAALVIPGDFSQKQASLRTEQPAASEIIIYINQGMNPAASTLAGQALGGIVDKMNVSVREQLLSGFDAQNALLTAKQASLLASPIQKQVINVNETGTQSANGNAPVSLLQPLWMASIASAAILYIALRKAQARTLNERLLSKVYQIGITAAAGIGVGFGLTWLARDMVGFAIPQYTDTAWFLTIAFISFCLLQTAVVSWLGLQGISIFALMLFFGIPLMTLAPELMSSFYREWIYSWLPMRFLVEGLRELFFFDQGLSWSQISVLTWIGLASAGVIMLSVYKPLAAADQKSLQG
ncbi:DUF3533 domain-containing protein [Paenibacillus sp. F411]|uniref:YhgE/Pip domain-containing protein n=1 Tax=Paenibacillus sp. F411 TaxID=2820239 RepID=UPI001AAE9422|nr:DUF3533 domain-containing protein [Paenibacillus sp. F411]MBO2946166.1 DUF3533 domain-containing protein [Paenibacillus sp. F411]